MNKANVGANTNFIQMVVDVVVCTIALLLSMLLLSYVDKLDDVGKCIAVSFVFTIVYILANKDGRMYNLTTFYYMDRVLKNISKSFILGMISTMAILFFFDNDSFDRLFLTTYLLISYVLLLTSTYIFRRIYKNKAIEKAPRTIFVGDKEQYEKLNYYVSKTNLCYYTVGYVRINRESLDGYLGYADDLEKIIRDNKIDQVFVIDKVENELEVQKYVDVCMEMGVTIKVVMDIYRDKIAKSYVSSIGTYPVVTYHTVSLNNSEKAIKRTMDIIGAIFGIIIFSPIMILSAILIKLSSPGPVIFKQVRVGMNGRYFHIFKFRTMYVDAEERKKELMKDNEVEGGFMFKMKDDPRITKVGKILRKTSIDELPQFFNVLIGDMSLVGTRPPTVDEVELYSRNHWRRISIKPGITGMWQVSGRSKITSFDEIVSLDTKYIDEWSVKMDLKVLIKTIIVLFKREGAY